MILVCFNIPSFFATKPHARGSTTLVEIEFSHAQMSLVRKELYYVVSALVPIWTISYRQYNKPRYIYIIIACLVLQTYLAFDIPK